jgi:hypothetical protein
LCDDRKFHAAAPADSSMGRNSYHSVHVTAGALPYSGDIVLPITGDKIDSRKITLLAERPLEELKQFKQVEAPEDINVAVLRYLFELLALSPVSRSLLPRAPRSP